MKRRNFIKDTAIAASAFSIIPSHVLSRRGNSPNDKIQIGFIGAGRQGITLGSIIRTANRLKNAKNLSKEGLRQEGFNILTGAIGRIGGTADSSYGVPNTFIGRSASNIKSGAKSIIKTIVRKR